MRSRPATLRRAAVPSLAVLVALGFLVLLLSAQEEGDVPAKAVAPEAGLLPSWSVALVDLCATIAPCGAVLCFLAPFPTIRQISRDRATGALPLLPYSSMVASGFVWFVYGVLRGERAVWAPNAIGVVLGSYYFATFVKHCGQNASNLPGTAGQHLRGTGAVVLFNLGLAAGGVPGAADIIGKEGVFFCVVLFASPLAALRTVVATRSASSIPLPFTMATLVNCVAWSVLGWYKMGDFNIYFPNLLGLSCAVAQLGLKGIYGSRPSGGAGKDLPR